MLVVSFVLPSPIPYSLCCVIYKNGKLKGGRSTSGGPQVETTKNTITFNAAYTRKDSTSPSLEDEDEGDERQRLLNEEVII